MVTLVMVRDTPLLWSCAPNHTRYSDAMPACHTIPFVSPGLVIAANGTEAGPPVTRETCDYCGSEQLEWRKCKLICGHCRQINKSCADL